MMLFLSLGPIIGFGFNPPDLLIAFSHTWVWWPGQGQGPKNDKLFFCLQLRELQLLDLKSRPENSVNNAKGF
jgi:hypothetical protein